MSEINTVTFSLSDEQLSALYDILMLEHSKTIPMAGNSICYCLTDFYLIYAPEGAFIVACSDKYKSHVESIIFSSTLEESLALIEDLNEPII